MSYIILTHGGKYVPDEEMIVHRHAILCVQKTADDGSRILLSSGDWIIAKESPSDVYKLLNPSLPMPAPMVTSCQFMKIVKDDGKGDWS